MEHPVESVRPIADGKGGEEVDRASIPPGFLAPEVYGGKFAGIRETS